MNRTPISTQIALTLTNHLWQRRPRLRCRTRRLAVPLLTALLLLLALLPSASHAAVNTPSGGTWSPTGNMDIARQGNTMTLLYNGKVLVAGGQDASGNSLSSAELYDPNTGTWTLTGSMTIARIGHTATLLPNGKVLVAGGNDSSGNPYSSAELYDPSTGQWTLTGSMITARGSHGALLLPTGKVLVAGGAVSCPSCPGSVQYLDSAELYDPNTGIWTAAGTMSAPRQALTATLLPDGQVLVAGGISGCCPYFTTSSADLYDPTNGTWTMTGSMTASRGGQIATLLPNGKVLVAGGRTQTCCPFPSLASAELYDPSTGTWSSTGSMSIAREDFTASLLPNGTVLVAGGWNDIPGTAFASAELYDPTIGAWRGVGSMSTARRNPTATLLADGQVLVAGGDDGSNSALASAELYTPDDQPPTTTATLTPLPNAAGWNNGPVTVTLSAGDKPGGSGVAATYYGLDTHACTTGSTVCSVYKGPFTVSSEGRHTLYYFSIDHAGNVEQERSTPINIDLTPPHTAVGFSGATTGCGAFYAPLTVMLNPTDTLSGISSTVNQLSGSPQTVYTGPYQLHKLGTRTLSFQSTDNAGNVEPRQSVSFTIAAPSLTSSASSGRYKDTLTLSGADFPAGETVSLYLDHTGTAPLATAMVTPQCAFSQALTVPQAISGTHTFIALAQSSGVSATVPFTVLPGAFLQQYQGATGMQDILKGAGFAPYETVKGYWNSPNGTPFAVTATTNGIGTFGGSSSYPGITFTVPLSPMGSYKVYAVGQSSHGVAAATVTLTAHLEVMPASGPAGSAVSVTGTGYRAHETVTLLYNCGASNCASTQVLGTPTTDSTGSFSAMAIIPTSTHAGMHSIGAKGFSSGAFAATTFTVTQ